MVIWPISFLGGLYMNVLTMFSSKFDDLHMLPSVLIWLPFNLFMLTPTSTIPLLFNFLGGLSLHLNHLIASRLRNFDWTFGTLPFELFGSNLDTMDLETYPRTYCGHFWHMSLFDNSRAVWVLFRKWVPSENHILLRNSWPTPGYSVLLLGGQVPRLPHGPIWFPIQNT